MTLSTASWGSFVAITVGGAAIWSNPKRTINRAFFVALLHVALWLLCLHFAFSAEEGLFWFRLASAVGGAFPAHLWLLKETILHPGLALRARFVRARAWLVLAVVFAALSLSDLFISADSRPQHLLYGYGYYGYIVGGFGAYVALAVATLWEMGRQQGVPRLELQILMLGGCLAAVLAHLFIALGAVLGRPGFARLFPLVVLALYSGTAWAIITTRVLDTRRLLSLIVEKAVLVSACAVLVWGLQQLSIQFIPKEAAFVFTLALGLWFASEVHPWLQEISQRSSRGEHVRRAAFAVARQELSPSEMEEAFLKVLRRWARCERAVILVGGQGRLNGGGLHIAADVPAMRALLRLRWVTPERLAREKPLPDRPELQTFLLSHGFGAMVTNGGANLSFVIGVDVPLSRRPYTYPEVVQLLELAAIIENALSRAHYVVKAQQAEQLATVGLLGASIAHEIRNPLVSIKTFVQLLPNHYQEAAFREKFFRLIGDEVGRIDRLTEQLLDLASPRVFTPHDFELHPLMHSCLDLIASKAEDKGVRLISKFNADPDLVYADPSALKQVILNLGFNAIEALEQQTTDRWIRLESRTIANGLEIIIEDSGPGLSPEARAHLFQPFRSTKSSGFGLGLAICKDILSSLQASIVADPPTSGRGAAFRIVLPRPRELNFGRGTQELRKSVRAEQTRV